MNITPLQLTGRCLNGAERDRGKRVHAVADGAWKALCGAAPGRHSAGWSSHPDPEVTCPRCLKKLDAVELACIKTVLKAGFDWFFRDEGHDPGATMTHHGIYASGNFKLRGFTFSMRISIDNHRSVTFITKSEMPYDHDRHLQPEMPEEVWLLITAVVNQLGLKIADVWEHTGMAYSARLHRKAGKSALALYANYGKLFCESCPNRRGDDSAPSSVFCECDFIRNSHARLGPPEGWS